MPVKNIINSHRFVIPMTWFLLLGALAAYPGFEAKCFLWGVIPGYLPFAIFGEIGHQATLLIMFALTAGMFVFAAWWMDRQDVTKWIWGALIVAIVVGAVIAHGNVDSFESWSSRPYLQVVMHPDYIPSASDYRRIYLLPQILSGAMIGNYFAVLTGLLLSFLGHPFTKH